MSDQSFNFNSENIVQFIYRNRRPIFIITLVAAVASVVVSLMITPKFESSVILYPKTQVSVSQALTNAELINFDKHIMNFGDKEATEQLIQTLHSEEIRFKIFERFKLLEHYNIDPEDEYSMTRLHKVFSDNVKFKKTEYQAVQIEVMDTDPQMAADIANEIAELLDETLNNMQNEVAAEILKVVEQEYNTLLNEITQIESSLKTFGAKISDPKFISLSQQLINENKRLSEVKSKLVEARVNANQQLPRKFIVANAYPAEKKSYPVRWLICSISTISAFLFAVFLMLFIVRYKNQFKLNSK